MQEEKVLDEYLSKHFGADKIDGVKDKLVDIMTEKITSQLSSEKQTELAELINNGATEDQMKDFLANSGLDINSISEESLKEVANE